MRYKPRTLAEYFLHVQDLTQQAISGYTDMQQP